MFFSFLLKKHVLIELAERVGVEPTVPFETHALQACALGHYATSPELILNEQQTENFIFFFSFSAVEIAAVRKPADLPETEPAPAEVWQTV